MSKFKNRLASIVLSTITIAGGVTTCLISGSAVYQCQAIIKDEEMKELINKSLTASFQQDPSLPPITADNLKEVLQKALDTITRGKHYEPLTAEQRNELKTLVNTFLLHFSVKLMTHLLHNDIDRCQSHYEKWKNYINILRATHPGANLSYHFLTYLIDLLNEEVPSACKYFPADFFLNWDKACINRLGSESLQTLLK